MTGFTLKKNNRIKSLGEKLIEHRQDKGISIDKAAKQIHLDVKYLKYFETDNYSKLPADIYAINMLKKYSHILDLNPDTAIELYKKEKSIFLKTTQKNTQKKDTALNKIFNFIFNPKFIKNSLIIIIVLSVLAYIGWEVNNIISPPLLTITNPADNQVITENKIKIIGQTELQASLKINNQPVLTDKNGHFKLTLDLQKGVNQIHIEAKKRYSKTNTIHRQIIVKDINK